MAKTSGPLMSVLASGSIKHRLTFSQRKGGSQCRFQRAQKDVLTEGRIAQRAKFSYGNALWRLLTPTEKGYWTTILESGTIEL